MNDNNNLNGTVLGSVDPNATPMPNPQPANNLNDLGPGVETLNQPVTPPAPNPVPPVGPEVSPVPINPEPLEAPAPMPSNPVGVPNPTNVPPVAPVMPESTPVMAEPLPVTPEPAYTNPSSIDNPSGAMPGFESSKDIGTTPPISFEPEKKPEKKTNKIVFIIIILVVLAGVGFGTFYVLKYTDLLNNKVAKISIVPKNLEINLGDTLSRNNNDYAVVTGTDISSCGVDTSNVDPSKVGEYTYTITCGETHRQGTITVVDNTVLEVALKTVYKNLNETLDPKEFATSNDSTLTYEFVDEDAVKTLLSSEPGTQTVKIRVTNANGKSVEVDGTLIILEHAVKGYITCSSKEEQLTDNKATMVVAERFGIADITGANSNDFANIIYEEHIFKFTDNEEYNKLLEDYQDNNSITINNITSNDIKFDDATHTITFTDAKDNEAAETEFGKENIAKYSTIKSYFETSMNYTCAYRKAETTTTITNNSSTN